MIKECPLCNKTYTTKDSRQKTCGWKCASKIKKHTWVAPRTITPTKLDLPDPETLPAAYVKSVHDLWERLVTDGVVQKRIA